MAAEVRPTAVVDYRSDAVAPTTFDHVGFGEVDEHSLSPQSEWSSPQVVEQRDAAATSGYESPSLYRRFDLEDASVEHDLAPDNGAAEPAERHEAASAEITPVGAVDELAQMEMQEYDAAGSIEPEVAAAAAEYDASSEAQVETGDVYADDSLEVHDDSPVVQSSNAFDDVATVAPVAMISAFMAEDRDTGIQERIAATLDRLASRIRSGEISLNHSANVASETAVLASLLTALLSEAL